MNYEKSVPFEGDFNKAAEVAKNTLMPHGFQIIKAFDSSIELEGTRSFMTRGENPLTGISRIHIQKENSSLIINAELDGLRMTVATLTIIYVIGILFISGILMGEISQKQAKVGEYLIILPIVLPALVVPFIFFTSMKSSAIAAVNTLLNNMIASGKY